ncbi:hypothetical protein D9615_008999 [Tricholomella constricta]|uniref:Uncharacterized protein n=1 Tax=Tricholomella constricta TaxID=117010 RepID=A0A8H5H0S0_9AGAR|nr:hypothetical protein D9615_008999 [Tricholomella constricta]
MQAFEFTRREFAKSYGTQLPVWALLASGSTGGSRIQLRPIPPTGTPVQYIAHELKAIVAESGFIPAAASTFTAFELTRGPSVWHSKSPAY